MNQAEVQILNVPDVQIVESDRKLMTIRVVVGLDGMDEIRNEWMNLTKLQGNRGIHQAFGWVRAAYETLSRGDKPYIVVLRTDRGKIVAIAPLALGYGKYRGITIRKLGFVRNDQSPCNDFILHPGFEKDAMFVLLEHLNTFMDWEMVDLHQVDIDGHTGKAIKSLMERFPYCSYEKKNRQSPYLVFEKGWNEFWGGKSRRLKKSINNKLNRLGMDYQVEKRRISDATAQELAEIVRISQKSWKRRIGAELAVCSDNWKFYTEICNHFGPEGCIHVWILRIEGIPVAFEFHVEYGGVQYPIKADYDDDFKKLSPGSILEYEIIRRSFNDPGLSAYHSCAHSYDYLLKWTQTIRDHRNYEFFAPKIKTIILYKFEYELMKLVRKSRLYRWYKERQCREGLQGEAL